jgi:cell division GTPase FtsZ
MSLQELDAAVTIFRDGAQDDCSIVFGYCYDESIEGEINITIIATGI